VIRATCAPTSTSARRRRAITCLQVRPDAKLPDLPKPRPYREIFVYSAARRGRAPALRPGRARRPALVGPARGLPHRGAGPGEGADGEEHRHRAGRLQGRILRASARRRPGDRDAQLAEGVACYRTVHQRPARHHRQPRRRQVVPPRRGAPRRDDPYLVVAADKGTATFSDIANAISPNTASGSAMPSPPAARSATTTRAWASPRAAAGSRSSATSARWAATSEPGLHRVGVGDMSGDVFGNGMLLSRHIRLVAAFDHRHIFLDPNPIGEVLRRARAPVRAAALRAGTTTTRG
jgi:glutamate dehydrogenase